ncbi:TetR/AcrR family transcriptional regulator [Rhizobium alvei]|uniref:TetR/AcrR family transcriptional regulator n=1 Tax=Rhizobium alvei TaxID=1132659 RepID=A0ABT8YP78_9HYPH|nr:TetR/AcrR family transcriptional regulator [Rhizobium alvei]MDO6965429.1 TetR/AcrR family transcriptional regulator [Rhizobium alvei]
MREEKRQERLRQIEDVTYRLIEEGGFEAVTMQAVAKRAGASLETLYRWYGDKVGLFRSLVERNADEIKALLAGSTEDDGEPLAMLDLVGQRLLSMLTGPRAIALNKAAVADGSGNLGRALAGAGRDTVAPLVGALFKRASASGVLKLEREEEAAEIWLSLLIGDLQIRRVTGQIPVLEPGAIEARSRRARGILLKLYKPDDTSPAML